MGSDEFTRRQLSVAQGVLRVLRIDPHIADGPDYARLVLYYWTYIDKAMNRDVETDHFYTTPERFKGAKSSESITRAFRRLVADEVIKLTQETEERRRTQESEYRDYYRGTARRG